MAALSISLLRLGSLIAISVQLLRLAVASGGRNSSLPGLASQSVANGPGKLRAWSLVRPCASWVEMTRFLLIPESCQGNVYKQPIYPTETRHTFTTCSVSVFEAYKSFLTLPVMNSIPFIHSFHLIETIAFFFLTPQA